MKKAAIFMDLDDTIFQTSRKIGLKNDLTVGAFGPNGEPLSFLTPSQVALLGLFRQVATVIPTTARNRESFGRVRLKFAHGAILNFGGLILDPQNEVDWKWYERTKPLTLAANNLLTESLALTTQEIHNLQFFARARIISDCDLPFYLVVKTKPERLFELEVLRDLLARRFKNEANIYLNDNNLALLPKFLDKKYAVEYFVDTYLRNESDDLLLFGMGDSFSDLGFLNLCDYQLIPSASQLGRRA
ncbi:MAG: hypothetical protein LBS60_11705 [Deltaproteobacteria bacterium]|jgi:hydroxymethylpyrimidine pyrophosphatase-like HAD family hydrolase|nr:hypothetical protein [Deltaproteobacteria bacterium]